MSDIKTKLQHFRNLVSLSIADGKIENSERVALSHIAEQNDIALDRLELMLNHASEYVYLIPQNNEEREHQLKDMIDLAIVDGEFSRSEYDLIVSVAYKLGFSKPEVDLFIESHSGSHKIV